MTKILNLDKLSAKETRELVLFGITYKVKEMSVDDFIETTRLAEEMEKEKSFSKQFQATVKLVKRSVPEIEEEVLKSMSLEQLSAVTAFIRGEDPEVIANNIESEGKGEGKGGKK